MGQRRLSNKSIYLSGIKPEVKYMRTERLGRRTSGHNATLCLGKQEDTKLLGKAGMLVFQCVNGYAASDSRIAVNLSHRRVHSFNTGNCPG